jgi:hypothetical protein
MQSRLFWRLKKLVGSTICDILIGLVAVFLMNSFGWSQVQAAQPNFQKKIISKTLEDSTQINTFKKKSPTGALLRSMIFPGWGQWYNEQKIKSAIAFISEGFLVGLAIHFNKKASENAPCSLERNFYTDRRNLTFWLLGGVTILSMIDAYVDAYLYDFDTGPDLSMRVGVISNSKNVRESPTVIGLSLRAKF